MVFKVLSLRLPENLHERARFDAWYQKRSLTSWIIEAITEKLERDRPA